MPVRAAIHFRGLGTQKLEAEIRARFPEAAVLRMDTDAMKAPGSHDRALTAFREGKVQILLGTQMIAKGLDFPNVTLVGVINADTALHLPDFRAAERTFQLVTQVAGRTGRGEKGGRVLVQTFSPEHPAIRAAVHARFCGVCARGTADARSARLSAGGDDDPTDRARHVARANESACAQTIGRSVARALADMMSPRATTCWGRPPPRLRNCAASIDIICSCTGPMAMRCASWFARRPTGWKRRRNLLWTADVDPLDML